MPKSATPDDELPLRVTLVDPPSGVLFRLGRGKSGLHAPVAEDAESITFALRVRVGPQADGSPNFLGPFAQGTPSERFFYVSVGTLAGQEDSPWTRAIKVPLHGITWEQIEAARRVPGAALVARIAGRAKDGGPACATVPLLDGGWCVESATR